MTAILASPSVNVPPRLHRRRSSFSLPARHSPSQCDPPSLGDILHSISPDVAWIQISFVRKTTIAATPSYIKLEATNRNEREFIGTVRVMQMNVVFKPKSQRHNSHNLSLFDRCRRIHSLFRSLPQSSSFKADEWGVLRAIHILKIC